jgi:hypothetical protein
VPLSVVMGRGFEAMLVIPCIGLGCFFAVWQGLGYGSALTLLLLDIGRSLRNRSGERAV